MLSIRSQKNISLDVEGLTGSKSLWSYFEILDNCQTFFLYIFFVFIINILPFINDIQMVLKMNIDQKRWFLTL